MKKSIKIELPPDCGIDPNRHVTMNTDDWCKLVRYNASAGKFVQDTISHGIFDLLKISASITSIINQDEETKNATPPEVRYRNPNMMWRHFMPALRAVGIERVRFHDLRHTYASLMLAQGENVKYVQTQLGDSTPTITLNVYAHLLEETNQEAVCRLENTIFQVSGHHLVTKEKRT